MIVIIIDGRWSRERQRGISVRRLGIAGFFGPNWGCVSHIAIQRRDERQESQDEAADGTRGEHHHLFDFPARRMLLPCYPRAVSTRQRSCGAPSQPESESPQDSLKLLLDRGSHKAVSRQWLLPPDALTFASRQELGATCTVAASCAGRLHQSDREWQGEDLGELRPAADLAGAILASDRGRETWPTVSVHVPCRWTSEAISCRRLALSASTDASRA